LFFFDLYIVFDILYFFYFFFSSRRRHTRLQGDWSSDVCSSDLPLGEIVGCLQMAKVPYRDILQAPNDLAEGRIQVLMTSFAVVQPQMQTGRVKVLAVTSRKRAPSAPEVLTVTEAGYPALEMESLVGLFGPRGMSSEL